MVTWCLSSVSVAYPVKIENPIRGWRVSEGPADELQKVQYPASSVNVVGKHNSSDLIRGSVKGPVKGADPLKIIINGLDMPLRPDGEVFSRPYVFGKGSNSIEVHSGGDRHAVQFYEASESRTPARLRVLLSWDTDRTDLDLHVVTPDGEHCYYGNRTLKNGMSLDVDVTTGYGPEIIAAPSPKNGTYLVYVNYYGSGERTGGLTTGKVSIVTNAGKPNEKIESSLIPLRAPGEVTLVKTFNYP